MEKNKVNVKINGRNYAIVGKNSEEYLVRVGGIVNEKIKEILSSNSSLSNEDAAIFAALSIADELLTLRDDHSAIDDRISKIIGSGSEQKTSDVFVGKRKN